MICGYARVSTREQNEARQLDALTAAGTARQLQRLVTEERPGACIGCGFEHNCRRDGCAVLRKVSRIVAVIDGKGAEK